MRHGGQVAFVRPKYKLLVINLEYSKSKISYKIVQQVIH